MGLVMRSVMGWVTWVSTCIYNYLVVGSLPVTLLKYLKGLNSQKSFEESQSVTTRGRYRAARTAKNSILNIFLEIG